MPECYICGAYIPQGTGYRRNVQTGTFTRFYITRHGGASLGYMSGTRTVCATCAAVIDRIAQGTGLRIALLLVGWCLSAVIGCVMLTSGTALGFLTGLLFVLGLPAFLIGGLAERQRRKEIEEDVFRSAAPLETVEVDARLPGESIDAWLDRIFPLQDKADRRVWAAYAKHHPPRIGQSVPCWVMSWPEWNPDWEGDPGPDERTFRVGDTILTWAERAAKSVAAQGEIDFNELKDGLIAMAKYAKPRVGEGIHEYNARAQERLSQIDRALDISSPASSIGEQESHQAWIERVAPLFLELEDGESIDDIIPRLVTIAQKDPPRPGESVTSWLVRTKASIQELNSAS